MAEKIESCAECTQNCLLIHSKRKRPSSIVPSFFKVMFGHKWSKIMFIPPEVAPTMSFLVNQIIQLQDSFGQCWAVTLSKVNGSLAFQKGWNKFSLENCLKEEDFLIFNYIRKSHFFFKIYGNNGRQKPIFSKENGARKNCRTSGNSSPENGGNSRKRSRTSGPQNGTSDKQASNFDFEVSESQPIVGENNLNLNEEVNVTAPVYTEEQFYMIRRDAGYVQEDYRTGLFDLSEFEMKTIPVEIEKNPSPAANSTVRSLTEVETDNNKFDGDEAKKSTFEDKRINGLDDSVMQSSDDADKGGTDPVVAEVPIVESPLETEHNIQKDKDRMPRGKLVLSAEKNIKEIDVKLKKDLAVSKKENFKNPEGKSNAYSSGIAKVVKTEIVDTFERPTFELYGTA